MRIVHARYCNLALVLILTLIDSSNKQHEFIIPHLFSRWNHTPLTEAVDHGQPQVEQFLKMIMNEEIYQGINGNSYEVVFDRGVTTV